MSPLSGARVGLVRALGLGTSLGVEGDTAFWDDTCRSWVGVSHTTPKTVLGGWGSLKSSRAGSGWGGAMGNHGTSGMRRTILILHKETSGFSRLSNVQLPDIGKLFHGDTQRKYVVTIKDV